MPVTPTSRILDTTLGIEDFGANMKINFFCELFGSVLLLQAFVYGFLTRLDLQAHAGQV
ncbi:hypothetical protein BDQ94DRAFT_143237 [Aspergillus welwitschiae]|uniref:Uncharacterized protein n=1 Tax=Aspergillus welwitschiae TaxID=1341132 RepID=A0A3F3Q3H6_9EURO|nr:hypothetical protein BDQ94DRAFT_143237 [Aspergillus welwitschiae]RDH33522.1 hypothetical protein BDQ94DRAFT_143237 [Aspergillus welwitschiae]